MRIVSVEGATGQGACGRPYILLFAAALLLLGGCGNHDTPPGDNCDYDTDCEFATCQRGVCNSDLVCELQPLVCAAGEMCNPASDICEPVGMVTCGDGSVAGGEVCDGDNLSGMTCDDMPGFAGGSLACASDCSAFDTSGCTEASSPVMLPYAFLATDGDSKVLGCVSPSQPNCEHIAAVPGMDEFPGSQDVAIVNNTAMIVGGYSGTPYIMRFSYGAGGGGWRDVSPADPTGTVTLSHVVGGEGGHWVTGGMGVLASTDNGDTWAPVADLMNVAWLAAGNGRYLAASGSTLWTSSDGLSWTDSGAGFGAGTPLAATWTGSQWVGIGSIPFGSGFSAYTSPDGDTWTEVATLGLISGISHVVAAEGVLLIVGRGGIARSADDGVSWMDVTPAGAGISSSLTHSATGGFLVGGRTGVLYRSMDAGMTWTEVLHPAGADAFVNVSGLASF